MGEIDRINRIEEGAKQELLAQGEVSLILDTYDDIFSDFDPRPYSHRTLSQDLLVEAKYATVSKEGTLELRFLIPKEKRLIEVETMIKKRLREHFLKHFHEKTVELVDIRKHGFFLIALGVLMMFLAIVFYSDLLPLHKIIKNIFIVLTEPAGWFLFWIGGEKIVYERREKLPEYMFYKKMSVAHISFISY